MRKEGIFESLTYTRSPSYFSERNKINSDFDHKYITILMNVANLVLRGYNYPKIIWTLLTPIKLQT